MRNLLKEPLVQFVAAGLALFLLSEIFRSDSNEIDSNRLVVDQDVLVKHLQYKKRAFNQAEAQNYYLSLSKSAREKLIADYIREEVLYREALALGLEEDDQIIRRRLIQKLDYISLGFADDLPEISVQRLAQYFSENHATYLIDSSITFTHVFFDADKHGASNAAGLARTTLDKLNNDHVAFEHAARYGDRFLFHRNYVDSTRALIASHFGKNLADALFGLSNADNTWHGPLISQYGAHLVMIKQIEPARLPELHEVAGIVLQDMRRELSAALRGKKIERLIGRYQVERNFSGDIENDT